jgi:serine/threonine protein kinase
MFLKHLNPFQINHLHDAISKEKLGEGGFGSVEIYQCKEHHEGYENCDKCFVVKKLRGHGKKRSWFNYNYEYDKKDFKILLQEYSTGVLLHHPNIRETLDVDLDSHYLIFEYCPGIDLYDFLCKKDHNTLNKKDIMNYFLQILNAMEYLHDQNIAHMDLKLENIILDTSCNLIKLIDFGQSFVYKINNREILYKGRSGTIQYAAPEVIKAAYYSAEKADIWSCGIVLFNLIYRKMPWSKADMTDLNYMLHISQHPGVLCEKLFKKLYDKGYTDEESDIIMNIFKITLVADTNKRKSIKTIKKIFTKLVSE